MNQSFSTAWTKTELIIFRFAFCYLILYFVFLGSAFQVFLPFLQKFQFNTPFQYISDVFVGLVNRLFIQQKFADNIYKGDGDTSWFYIAIFSYFLLAVLVTIVWTLFAKRTNYLFLFICVYTFARYYLAFILFGYGFGKLFGAQFFDPQPTYLMQPLGNIDSHTLLWTFMGASKAYNYFGGLMETIPAVLLLFRRTASLGAFLAIATLTNVLLLNIGYDTLVKWLSAHLILIALFIISPDIKRVFNFFFLNKNTSLTTIVLPAINKKIRLIQYGLKYILIAYAVFSSIKLSVEIKENYSKPYFGNIDGIYDIEKFYRSQPNQSTIPNDAMHWRKIGINKFGEIAIQYTNDSVIYRSIEIDTVTKSLALSSWNDSTFKCNLSYTINGSNEYVFEGNYKKDSIRFSAKKMNLQSYPLLKGKGKIKWVWW
ncbi:MAG TPA: hypothetical protein VFP97_07050 [Chitinophagaceae bacterium]|nr:hypothetical protein [Chitinophagaceae bacterium]